MRHNSVLQWVLLWGLAILITGAAMVYQNLTGPTHPKRIDLRLSEDQQYSLKLPRSHGGETDCPVELHDCRYLSLRGPLLQALSNQRGLETNPHGKGGRYA